MALAKFFSIYFLCPSCWNLPRWCRFGSDEGIEQGRPRPAGEGSGRTAGCRWSRTHSAAASTRSASGQAKPQPGQPWQGRKLPGTKCRQEPFPQPMRWHICPPEKHFCFSERGNKAERTPALFGATLTRSSPPALPSSAFCILPLSRLALPQSLRSSFGSHLTQCCVLC